MNKAYAGVLIAAAALGGMYAVAATTATTIAASFETAAPARFTPLGEFAADVTRAANAYRVAREKCDSLTGKKKNACRSEARAQANRILVSARQL